MSLIGQHGGKRPGAGRKKTGTTRKKSLSLSNELWEEIDAFDGTISDYIRFLKANHSKSLATKMSEIKTEGIAKINPEKKAALDEFMNYKIQDYLELNEDYPKELIPVAKKALENSLYDDSGASKIETVTMYINFNTGKPVKSLRNLIDNLIPKFFDSERLRQQRRKEAQQREQAQKNRPW